MRHGSLKLRYPALRRTGFPRGMRPLMTPMRCTGCGPQIPITVLGLAFDPSFHLTNPCSNSMHATDRGTVPTGPHLSDASYQLNTGPDDDIGRFRSSVATEQGMHNETLVRYSCTHTGRRFTARASY